MPLRWEYHLTNINWNQLAAMYQAVPLGDKSPDTLREVYSNSRYYCFIFDDETLIGAGRALADGRDCSYICDIGILPKYQSQGLGKKIVQYLVEQSKNHKKIILYANPGKEGFYAKLGFKKMNTAMAIFRNEEAMVQNGTLSKD